MKKLRILSLLLIICLCFSVSAPAVFAIDEPTEANDAKAIVLADLDSGNILYSKNMNEQRSPASLTKVMTGLLAVEAVERGEVSMDEIVTAGNDCRQGLDTDSSTVNITPGEQMPFKDLLYCALVHSANEACNVIATRVSGSISAFVEDMNRRAAQLGCTGTHFADTNGLSNNNHYSTAYDLYLITREAIQHKIFAEAMDLSKYDVAPTNYAGTRNLFNSNALISTGSIYGDNYIYQYAHGVKTGYTRAAGYCLISTAEKKGTRVMAVVLGCGGALNTGDTEFRNFTVTRALYNWTFENFSKMTLISPEEPIQTVKIDMADGDDSVILYPARDISFLMPNDITQDDITKTITVYSEKLVAPIEAGTALGEVNVIVNGTSYGSVKLISARSVELSRNEYMKAQMRQFLSKGWVKLIIVLLVILLISYFTLVARYRRLRREHLRQRRLAEQKRAAAKARREMQERRLMNGEDPNAPPRRIEPIRRTGSAELDEILRSYRTDDEDDL